MGANRFMGTSDLDFCCFLVENFDKSGTDFHICSIFHSKVYYKRKSCQKVWVLAPTTLKSMGAEAPTAPILTGALSPNPFVGVSWCLRVPIYRRPFYS